MVGLAFEIRNQGTISFEEFNFCNKYFNYEIVLWRVTCPQPPYISLYPIQGLTFFRKNIFFSFNIQSTQPCIYLKILNLIYLKFNIISDATVKAVPQRSHSSNMHLWYTHVSLFIASNKRYSFHFNDIIIGFI